MLAKLLLALLWCGALEVWFVARLLQPITIHAGHNECILLVVLVNTKIQLVYIYYFSIIIQFVSPWCIYIYQRLVSIYQRWHPYKQGCCIQSSSSEKRMNKNLPSLSISLSQHTSLSSHCLFLTVFTFSELSFTTLDQLKNIYILMKHCTCILQVRMNNVNIPFDNPSFLYKRTFIKNLDRNYFVLLFFNIKNG